MELYHDFCKMHELNGDYSTLINFFSDYISYSEPNYDCNTSLVINMKGNKSLP